MKTIIEYESAINKSWNKCVEGILETGRHFIDAKKDLELIEYNILRDNVRLSDRTIQRLVAIAKDKRIATHVSVMPASWGTLYELTTLDDGEFDASIKSKLIYPDMTRNDVSKIKNGSKKPEKAKPQYNGMVKAYVVYCHEDALDELSQQIDELVSSSHNFDVDSCGIEEHQNKLQKKEERKWKKATKAGYTSAVKDIRAHLNDQKKKLGKDKAYSGCGELKDFLENANGHIRTHDMVN